MARNHEQNESWSITCFENTQKILIVNYLRWMKLYIGMDRKCTTEMLFLN
jgi:hypothetical protein